MSENILWERKAFKAGFEIARTLGPTAASPWAEQTAWEAYMDELNDKAKKALPFVLVGAVVGSSLGIALAAWLFR
jgi:hypothetical protein